MTDFLRQVDAHTADVKNAYLRGFMEGLYASEDCPDPEEYADWAKEAYDDWANEDGR